MAEELRILYEDPYLVVCDAVAGACAFHAAVQQLRQPLP